VKYYILQLKVYFLFFGGFFFKISILEVENGKNRPGILGVKHGTMGMGELVESHGGTLN
jgi:hypothetical protein